MGLSTFESFRLFFILFSYTVVCLASRSFPPSEQTAFQVRSGQTEQPLTNPNDAYESRLQVQKLLHLESEMISFCRLIIEQDEILHHAEDSYHDSEHIKR